MRPGTPAARCGRSASGHSSVSAAHLGDVGSSLLGEVGGQQRAQALGDLGGGFGEAEVGLAVADPRRDLRPGVADQVKLHAARIPK